MEIFELVRELERGMDNVQAFTQGFTLAEARLRPSPQDWSLLEVIAHLHDEERQDFRPRLKIALFHPQEAWEPIDPQAWVEQRRYNERELSETLQAFLVERIESLAWLRSLDAPDWGAVYPAPFGPIRAGDLLAAWAAHDLLHLRQLIELRRYRLAQMSAPFNLRYAGD